MPTKSAGLILFRERGGEYEVLLVHPGGPFWAKKDAGSWSIPKGEFTDEQPFTAALREFQEETGVAVHGDALPLQPLRQPSGKIVYAWAMQGDLDPAAIRSNTFPLEWPPKSGRIQNFPEVDRAGWFSFEAARRKLLKGQVAFVDQLEQLLNRPRE
jgi:predicted NUDIX family NTP pyrophosphohydrolase